MCINFTVPKGNFNYCENAVVCQTMTGDYYKAFSLGTIDSVQFLYENNTVIAVYQSGSQPYGNRTTKIELACDPDEVLGKMVFIEEQPITLHRLKLYTRCACPGGCTSTQKECVMKDGCSVVKCRMVRG